MVDTQGMQRASWDHESNGQVTRCLALRYSGCWCCASVEEGISVGRPSVGLRIVAGCSLAELVVEPLEEQSDRKAPSLEAVVGRFALRVLPASVELLDSRWAAEGSIVADPAGVAYLAQSPDLEVVSRRTAVADPL